VTRGCHGVAFTGRQLETRDGERIVWLGWPYGGHGRRAWTSAFTLAESRQAKIFSALPLEAA
jgi:hypothetical protein